MPGSQWRSSQSRSASRASLRRSNGPSTGPPTGVRSACQRPSLVGLDVAGTGDRGAAEHAEVDRLVVDRPDRPVGLDEQLHEPAPGAGALRRIRRRGRSTSMASSDAWTRESCVATWPRRASLSRRSWAPTFRTARCAWATRSSSCWFDADVQRAEPLEEVRQVVHGRVAEDLRACRPRWCR